MKLTVCVLGKPKKSWLNSLKSALLPLYEAEVRATSDWRELDEAYKATGVQTDVLVMCWTPINGSTDVQDAMERLEWYRQESETPPVKLVVTLFPSTKQGRLADKAFEGLVNQAYGVVGGTQDGAKLIKARLRELNRRGLLAEAA